MKHIFAFERKSDYEKHQDIIYEFSEKLEGYQEILINEYALNELPKGVLWTTEELATTVFANIPLPAYTNKDLIYMSPNIDTWKKIFMEQLDGKELPDIQEFYEKHSENEVFIILAHELTHHLDLFLDEFDDEREEGIWFEEGMCFYLPRKILLNEKEFHEITQTETELVEAFKDEYGDHSLEDFGSSSYQGSISSILFDYWRSYIAVKYLVETVADNDIKSVFNEYHQWDQEGRILPLSEYFNIKDLFK